MGKENWVKMKKYRRKDKTYKHPRPERNDSFGRVGILRNAKEYSHIGKSCLPYTPNLTEYEEEYRLKYGPCVSSKGVSVEKLTTCPLIDIGRDEREPLPLTNNYFKYLDIYLTTTRLYHRYFNEWEQKTIAAKNIVTSQETMEIPKARPFGCKFPEFAGQDLDNRNPNMYNRDEYKFPPKPRFMRLQTPKVPNFGSESETQASYTVPQGNSLARAQDRHMDFKPPISVPTAGQILVIPGMYKTEGNVIHDRTSPQKIV